MKKMTYILIVICLSFLSCDEEKDLKKYSDHLQNYALYDYSEEGAFNFSYMDSSHTKLKNLKKAYDLESIAGQGDELSQIFNLMIWVNENIRHDGSSTNPFPPNADNIIETCKKEDRGVNCRMLATVLNDFYLAVGIKSRHITCMPYEQDYDDCHVVNVVFSTQLDKWIMMDPSFAGYFKDENEGYLGLSEVRERLINNDFLEFSNHLNHNGKKYTQKTYKTYMAKNLFRFSCPAVSEYNYEAKRSEDRAYIELIPSNYVTGQNAKITRNPGAFWARQ